MKKTLKWKLAQFFEIRWWKKYQKDKGEKYLKSKSDYWNKILDETSEYAPLKESHNILDAGCGPSGMYMVLQNRVDAVDPLLNDYESNIHFFSKSNHNNVTFFSQAFETFESKKEYDMIFCMNAINHFSELDKSLNKLNNLLTNDGKMILGVDVHKSRFLKGIFSFLSFDILHPHQYTLHEYDQIFKKSGFNIIYSKTLKKGGVFNYELYILDKSKK